MNRRKVDALLKKSDDNSEDVEDENKYELDCTDSYFIERCSSHFFPRKLWL